MSFEVSVLLSTYNGVSYIRQQIDSILSQVGVKVHLFIRDDGSTDGTQKLLKKYEGNSSVSIIYGLNIGYAASFLSISREAVKSSSNEYFAFSDQDDMWKDDKLLCGVNALANCHNSYRLYFSALEIVDKDLRPLGKKSYKAYKLNFGSALARSSVAGCTMVFSRQLLSKAIEVESPLPSGIGHDAWIYKVCLMYRGYVTYDDDSHILFRRHVGNTSDAGGKISQKIKIFQKLISTEKDSAYNSAVLLLRTYSDDIPHKELARLDEIHHYRDSLINRGRLAVDSYFDTNVKQIDLARFVLVLIGRF